MENSDVTTAAEGSTFTVFPFIAQCFISIG